MQGVLTEKSFQIIQKHGLLYTMGVQSMKIEKGDVVKFRHGFDIYYGDVVSTGMDGEVGASFRNTGRHHSVKIQTDDKEIYTVPTDAVMNIERKHATGYRPRPYWS
jgi:hypothetical protein